MSGFSREERTASIIGDITLSARPHEHTPQTNHFAPKMTRHLQYFIHVALLIGQCFSMTCEILTINSKCFMFCVTLTSAVFSQFIQVIYWKCRFSHNQKPSMKVKQLHFFMFVKSDRLISSSRCGTFFLFHHQMKP